MLAMLKYLAKWIPIAGVAGVMAGSASALLLVSLEWATALRERHVWLIALLPLAGLVVGCVYEYAGRTVEAGNNLVLEEIHREVRDGETRVISWRMAPLVLFGTVMTHLFGGSAGREGTAIQMGASLADQLGRPLRLGGLERRVLLMAGVAAGFASVFGTPLAGAVFGMEVLLAGAISYEAIGPCFVAAFVGDLTTRAWGVQHTVYRVTEVPGLTLGRLAWAGVAGVAFGLVAMGFARATHWVGGLMKRRVGWAPLRPVLGGALVAAGVFAGRTTRYIGLGVPTIVEAFGGRHRPWDFLAKFGFTVVTLGASFKGGEVTPLFFIGATLGNALSYAVPLPTTLLAGMGFVAVFAGAANTPVASTLMAMELFGGEVGAYAGVACVVSYLFSGRGGIYAGQRSGLGKLGDGC